ncbi:MAG: hypothetical protein ACI8TP_003981 [Acidimicrobiales bacterium]|jgi:hypothetical protein
MTGPQVSTRPVSQGRQCGNDATESTTRTEHLMSDSSVDSA